MGRGKGHETGNIKRRESRDGLRDREKRNHEDVSWKLYLPLISMDTEKQRKEEEKNGGKVRKTRKH